MCFFFPCFLPCAAVWISATTASIRAFRASVRNEEYVRDVLEQKAKKEAEAAAEKERERERQKVNPFSVRPPFQIEHPR